MTTPTPTRGPCSPWDPIWCCDISSEAAIALTGTAVQAATEILYNLTAQQFDVCRFTVRPCREDCFDQAWGATWGGASGSWWEWGSYWPRPALIAGSWYNLTCGGCSGSCSCTPLSIALLPSPVSSIIDVKINGASLPASGYRVDDYRKLVRLGGFSWPICQDLNLDDTQDNTWSVTVEVGQAIPTIGRMAVGELACEIMRGCLGDECAIPFNAVNITRQGISIDLPTFYELLTHGLLGLKLTDTFISTYNPNRLKSVPQVYDVDGESYTRTTWP
jgi:hypothetical protein